MHNLAFRTRAATCIRPMPSPCGHAHATPVSHQPRRPARAGPRHPRRATRRGDAPSGLARVMGPSSTPAIARTPRTRNPASVVPLARRPAHARRKSSPPTWPTTSLTAPAASSAAAAAAPPLPPAPRTRRRRARRWPSCRGLTGCYPSGSSPLWRAAFCSDTLCQVGIGSRVDTERIDPTDPTDQSRSEQIGRIEQTHRGGSETAEPELSKGPGLRLLYGTPPGPGRPQHGTQPSAHAPTRKAPAAAAAHRGAPTTPRARAPDPQAPARRSRWRT